jgi:hypothetical protein
MGYIHYNAFVICVFTHLLFYLRVMRSISALLAVAAEATMHAQFVAWAVPLTCPTILIQSFYHSISHCCTMLSVHSIHFLFYAFSVYTAVFRYAIAMYKRQSHVLGSGQLHQIMGTTVMAPVLSFCWFYKIVLIKANNPVSKEEPSWCSEFPKHTICWNKKCYQKYINTL